MKGETETYYALTPPQHCLGVVFTSVQTWWQAGPILNLGLRPVRSLQKPELAQGSACFAI